MGDTAIIALVVLGGIFLILCITILKHGIDDAIKIWSLLGVAFGAIISFYFTSHVKDQIRQQAVAAVTAQKQAQIAEVNEKLANAKVSLLSLKYGHEFLSENVKKSLAAYQKNPSSPRTEALLYKTAQSNAILYKKFKTTIDAIFSGPSGPLNDISTSSKPTSSKPTSSKPTSSKPTSSKPTSSKPKH